MRIIPTPQYMNGTTVSEISDTCMKFHGNDTCLISTLFLHSMDMAKS